MDMSFTIREIVKDTEAWSVAVNEVAVRHNLVVLYGFPGGSVVKNPPANAGDMGLIPGLGQSPGEGNGNPLQYSCLGNPMDIGARWATVRVV